MIIHNLIKNVYTYELIEYFLVILNDDTLYQTIVYVQNIKKINIANCY